MLEIFNFLIFYQEHWVTGPQVRPPRSPRPKTETYDFDDANGLFSSLINITKEIQSLEIQLPSHSPQIAVT